MSNERFSAILHASNQQKQRQRRMNLALAASTLATASFMATILLGERIRVVAVAPPSINYVMVSLNMEPMLPVAAQPPQAPRAEPPPQDDAPQDDMNVDDAIPSDRPIKPTRPQLKPMTTGIAPFASTSVCPGCVPGGIQSGNGQRGSSPAQGNADPLHAVMARAIYQPLPASAALQQSPTGRTSRNPGSVTVAFCVETTGKVGSATIVRGFPNDSSIDAIVRDTVRTWRFSPMVIGDKARRMCAEKVFHIKWK